ncbi:hypothetical protein WN944_006493 [Citrus x changshan-huyou]|uniref:Uncharacterized protein n=1 Tax=Citrus x changshan-huyou TaxID=2935761 RepID=A0AAP0QTJ5_9ROSI
MISVALLMNLRMQNVLRVIEEKILMEELWQNNLVDPDSTLEQAALEKGKIVEKVVDGEIKTEEVVSAENLSHGSASTDSLTSQMNELSVSANPVVENPLSDANDPGDAGAPGQDIDKRIRAIKKKKRTGGIMLGRNAKQRENSLPTFGKMIRLSEAQQQKAGQQELKPEQLEKLSKLEGWRNELKLLEEKKAELEAS